jgi:hypothetical protein
MDRASAGGGHDRKQFPIEAPPDECHLMDGATGTNSKDNGTFLKLLRSTTPGAIGQMQFLTSVETTSAPNRNSEGASDAIT